MLKFLCYRVQLIIQNIGNMINYNHSPTHVMPSLLGCARWPEIIDDYEALASICESDYQVKSWACNLKCDNVSTTTTISKKNNYQSTTTHEMSSKLCAYYLCEPRYQCPLVFLQNEIQKDGLMSPPLQDFNSFMNNMDSRQL